MDVGRNGNVSPRGRTCEEAQTGLHQCGLNAVQVRKPHPAARHRPKVLGIDPVILAGAGSHERLEGTHPQAARSGSGRDDERGRRFAHGP